MRSRIRERREGKLRRDLQEDNEVSKVGGVVGRG